ncbi:MAG: thiamine phosphate synthase [Verrucomicrobiae bacterium]|nr:thiamine phosphate synthase [Verrucomicrobiae bacterium]
MKAIADCRLYGILDLGYVDREALIRVTGEMLTGGIDIIQLRAKRHSPDEILAMGREILPLTRDAGVPLVINDHAEVAAELGADGVHVGQDDLSMEEVRAIVGDDMMVGRSTHSVDQARGGAAEGAGYLGFGPLFATLTKPDYVPIGLADIAQVHSEHPGLPIFCIGGIKREIVSDLVAAGARRVVIVSGILQAPDIAEYVREAKAMLPAIA